MFTSKDASVTLLDTSFERSACYCLLLRLALKVQHVSNFAPPFNRATQPYVLGDGAQSE
jgi:hypothetical protein